MNTYVVDETYAATLKYKPQEFAQHLGVSVKTLQRWDREGILKAHRTVTNRRYYTYDQFKSITEKQQYDGIIEKRRSILRAGLMTRGDLYVMFRDVLLKEEKLNVPEGRDFLQHEGRGFLQQLINQMLELPARWPTGAPMEQTVRLDADLVWDADVKQLIYKCWSGWGDDSPQGIICRYLVDALNDAARLAERQAEQC